PVELNPGSGELIRAHPLSSRIVWRAVSDAIDRLQAALIRGAVLRRCRHRGGEREVGPEVGQPEELVLARIREQAGAYLRRVRVDRLALQVREHHGAQRALPLELGLDLQRW